MYDRHIDTKLGLVFINKNNSVQMDTSILPSNISFYVENENDWWIERKPFIGREKNEDVRHIALKILADAEKIWKEQQESNES